MLAAAFSIISDGVSNCNGFAATMTGFGVGENSLAYFALKQWYSSMLAQLYLDSLTGWYGVVKPTDEKRSPKL
jgi:hypothetical protein